MSAAVAIAGDGPVSAAKRGGKKKLVLLAVPVLLLLAGGGLWFSGIIPGMLHGKPATAEQPAAKGKEVAGKEAAGKEAGKADKEASAKAAPVFVELPEMIANLNVAGRRASFVKLRARLEVAKPEDAEALKALQPRIVDLFQTYLREMRPEELRGSAGTYRLREELVTRANLAAAPARVVDVLFTELLVQ